MANPVNNAGINAKVSVGDLLNVDVKIGGSAKVSDNQSKGIFQNVNENYTKNPNHAAPAEHAEDTNPQFRASAKDNTPPGTAKDIPHDENPAPPNRNNGANNQTNEPNIGEDANLVNQPNRGKQGDLNASEQGLENGRGHHKVGNQGQTQETPPIIVQPNEETGNPKIIRTQNTPPIIVQPNDGGNGGGRHGGNHNFPTVWTPRNTNGQTNQPNMGEHFSVDYNLRTHGNQPNNLIRTVVNQVLRQNDIYLNQNTLNRLVNNQTFQNSSNKTMSNLPREVNNLVQNIGTRVLSLLDNSQQNGRLIHQISKEISHQIQENIQTAKNSFFKNADFNAVQFKNLNVVEKMHVAVELLPQHVPAKALENLQNYKTQEVLNGLLLARGLVVPSENTAEVRNLVASKSAVLPSEVSIAALRDVGQLVKVLIADSALAKTTANLDLAVQKFVRILLANNELGVLLATVNLAAQTQSQGGLISRSLALAQIYELINRLIQAGEKALKEAQPENGAKNILQKDRNIFQTVGVKEMDEADELKIQSNKLHNADAAGSLRQFLEFNPSFVYDNSASAFNNPDDAREAQKDFVNLYHDDIAQWLESGKHRFVKDFDFDKPVGVVVERSNERLFTASTARFVLVRDGSVQGWHFLKSFLVK